MVQSCKNAHRTEKERFSGFVKGVFRVYEQKKFFDPEGRPSEPQAGAADRRRGVAAYKALELVRLLRKAGVAVRADPDRRRRPVRDAAVARRPRRGRGTLGPVLIGGEAEMGHIELSRSADLVVVARPRRT